MNKEQPPFTCSQMSHPGSGITDLSLTDRGRQLLLRLLSAVERRVRRARSRLMGSSEPLDLAPYPQRSRARLASSGLSPGEAGDLHPGDLVQVLSLEQIRSTLDESGFCEGLEFMEAMADLCGQTLVVMKRVRLFYDETERRMLKVNRPRYILEGAICHGKDAYDREGCDRSCYYFWSPRWLCRVEGAEDGAKGSPPPRTDTP